MYISGCENSLISLTFIHEDGQRGKLVDGNDMDVDEEEGEVRQLITLSTIVTKKHFE